MRQITFACLPSFEKFDRASRRKRFLRAMEAVVPWVELEDSIGISRETVARMLSKFKRDKLIQMRGATIVILAPDKLELMAA